MTTEPRAVRHPNLRDLRDRSVVIKATRDAAPPLGAARRQRPAPPRLLRGLAEHGREPPPGVVVGQVREPEPQRVGGGGGREFVDEALQGEGVRVGPEPAPRSGRHRQLLALVAHPVAVEAVRQELREQRAGVESEGVANEFGQSGDRPDDVAGRAELLDAAQAGRVAGALDGAAQPRVRRGSVDAVAQVLAAAPADVHGRAVGASQPGRLQRGVLAALAPERAAEQRGVDRHVVAVTEQLGQRVLRGAGSLGAHPRAHGPRPVWLRGRVDRNERGDRLQVRVVRERGAVFGLDERAAGERVVEVAVAADDGAAGRGQHRVEVGGARLRAALPLQLQVGEGRPRLGAGGRDDPGEVRLDVDEHGQAVAGGPAAGAQGGPEAGWARHGAEPHAGHARVVGVHRGAGELVAHVDPSQVAADAGERAAAAQGGWLLGQLPGGRAAGDDLTQRQRAVGAAHREPAGGGVEPVGAHPEPGAGLGGEHRLHRGGGLAQRLVHRADRRRAERELGVGGEAAGGVGLLDAQLLGLDRELLEGELGEAGVYALAHLDLRHVQGDRSVVAVQLEPHEAVGDRGEAGAAFEDRLREPRPAPVERDRRADDEQPGTDRRPEQQSTPGDAALLWRGPGRRVRRARRARLAVRVARLGAHDPSWAIWAARATFSRTAV